MNPHADSVQQPSEAELLYLWDTYVGDPTAKYPFTDDDKVVFARAVLARFGTRPAAEPLLLQDENSGRDGRRYNEWHASRPDARLNAREAAAAIAAEPIQSGSAVDFEQWWLAEVAANGGVPIGADYKHWAKAGFELRGDARAPAAPAEADPQVEYELDRAFKEGMAYEAKRIASPAAPTPADPQALLGWTRYEKARKLNVAQWAELHQRNLRGENFDDMIDALPATTQPAQQDTALSAFDLAVATELPCVSTVEYNSHEICKWFAANVRKRLAATPPAEKQAAPSGEDKPKCRDCADFGPICPNSGRPCATPAPQDTKGADNHG
jgi:hypothetical protein